MNFHCLGLFLTLCLVAMSSYGQVTKPSAALHLVTYQSWGFTIDTTPQGQRVRRILQDSRRLGFDTVVFNFRGHMITGTGSDIRSTVPGHEQATEERLLLETAAYAKSLGLKVAFRPILLVVGPKGEFPYVERGRIYWWHGVIKPRNPQSWFQNYFKLHERYLRLAAKAGAAWYSIGAEMNSMTSGLGDRDRTQRLGYPQQWVDLIHKARAILGPQTQITYGINYTDQYIVTGGLKTWGGELEQWRYYLTESFKQPINQQHQKDLQELWSELDLIGIDYYRAFGSTKDTYSNNFSELVRQLEERPLSHASQLDNVLTEVAMTLGSEKSVFFQEVGYRSVEKCFLHPASFESEGGKFNSVHQAAAWEAFFRAYWLPQWPWMTGVGVWQVLVDEDANSPTDRGFTPLAKPAVEAVFLRYLK